MTLPEFPEPVSGDVNDAAPPARQAPLKFEPVLVSRLRAAQSALNARFAEVFAVIEKDPPANTRAIEECARQFGAVRQFETTWLYPLLAQAVQADADARGQLMELRLVGLILARRVQRSFDDLLQSVRAEVFIMEAAGRASSALARYTAHSDHSVYPLYELIGSQPPNAAQVA